MKSKQAFTKKRTFNTSYYRKQITDENTKHYQIKRYIGNILRTYYFKVFYEYTHPQLVPYYDFAGPLANIEKPRPYQLDILAYNEQIGQVITCEVNGPYHYTGKQQKKDDYRKNVIVDWVRKYLAKNIEWKTDRWTHKHVAVSRDDVYHGFLDYDGLIVLMRL